MSSFCYTCLSEDRELSPVDTSHTKPMLLDWFKESKFKVNVDHFQLCWECFALIMKLIKFKRQVFRSQQIRLRVQKKKSARLVSQTKLCVYTKVFYDGEYVFEECGPEITQTNTETSKRKHHSSSKTKTKRRKALEPDPEPIPEPNPEPKETVPKESVPKESVPKESVPKKSVPKKSVPKKSVPKESVPKESVPKESVPKESVPKESVPKESVPKKSAPIESDPNESVPNIYHITYNFFNDPNLIKIKKELIKDVSEGKEKTKRVKDNVVDLTKDPKLCAIPVVLIDKEIKQELIDAYEAEIENKNSTLPIFINAGQDRPSVIMKAIPSDETEKNWEDSSLKFTIVNLTEDQMLQTRELDRSERVYMKHFLKCESCVIGFAEESELDKHNKEKHDELIGNFECPICDTRFKNEYLLTRHENTHYFSFKCRQCDFQHHRRYVIEKHVVKEHDLAPSPVCAACDTEFATQQRLNAHFEKAHKEKLKCNQCAQSFDTVERLKDHATSHKEADEVVEIFPCEACKGIFEGKAAYRAHVQCVHKELARHAYCGQCDLQFDTMKKFKLHVREHSAFDQLKFDLPSGNSEDTAGNMKRVVHRMLTHKCGLCKKGFSDEMRLKEHIQQKHPQVVTLEPVVDQICDLSTAPSSPLQDVSLADETDLEEVTECVIEPVKEKSCQICSDTFFTHIELLDHMRTHKAEKNFKCDVCDKSFITKMLLRKHVRTHATD